jgi:hypothetical protein
LGTSVCISSLFAVKNLFFLHVGPVFEKSFLFLFGACGTQQIAKLMNELNEQTFDLEVKGIFSLLCLLHLISLLPCILQNLLSYADPKISRIFCCLPLLLHSTTTTQHSNDIYRWKLNLCCWAQIRTADNRILREQLQAKVGCHQQTDISLWKEAI